jgi:hypothetical protein
MDVLVAFLLGWEFQRGRGNTRFGTLGRREGTFSWHFLAGNNIAKVAFSWLPLASPVAGRNLAFQSL